MHNVADSYQDGDIVSYDCGPNAVFKVTATSATFQRFESKCTRNQTWDPPVLPICYREWD